MQTNNYVLPEWRFVGGETQTRIFTLYRMGGSVAYDIPNASIELSIVDFVHPKSTPTKLGVSEIQSDDDGVFCNVSVKLSPRDTVNLSGKFIYQLSIKDGLGNVSISKGIMYISENIDKSFI